jgi:hypothetical protein
MLQMILLRDEQRILVLQKVLRVISFVEGKKEVDEEILTLLLRAHSRSHSLAT